MGHPLLHFRLTHHVSFDLIESWAMTDKECVMSINTSWWSLYDQAWMPYRSGALPCDPRGSMLVQGSLREFWDQAKGNPDHYGRHGLDALLAAFHGNLQVLRADGQWRPTCFEGWEQYNALIDKEQSNGRT